MRDNKTVMTPSCHKRAQRTASLKKGGGVGGGLSAGLPHFLFGVVEKEEGKSDDEVEYERKKGSLLIATGSEK